MYFTIDDGPIAESIFRLCGSIGIYVNEKKVGFSRLFQLITCTHHCYGI